MASAAADLPLSMTKCGIGVSWDSGARATVDLDLQAVAVDRSGSIIDAVYYNNLKALGSIVHSGDERTGEAAGIDEIIWVNLNKVPEHVRLILFVLAAYSGGHLCDAHNGVLHVLSERKDAEVARFAMEQSPFNVDAVAMLLRGASGGWSLRVVEEPAQEGRHFMDILEPTLGNLIRSVIPGAPKRQKVAFAMEKGGVVDLPETASIGQVSAALGWDVNKGGGDVDLDVSAVFFSKEAKHLGAVFFGNTEEFGLQHSGDNLTGEGEGDDETIVAKLHLIPPEVNQIFFVVNIYTNNVSFDRVSNAYCRILDSCGHELARYVLREGRGERGLIIARLFREHGDRWGFQALGKFCRGKTWKDSVADMAPLARMDARAFQLRGSSSMSLDGGGHAHSHHDEHEEHSGRRSRGSSPGSHEGRRGKAACSLM